MIVGWIFDAKMGGLEMQNKAFRIIVVAKYKVSVFRKKASKIERQLGSQNDPRIKL